MDSEAEGEGKRENWEGMIAWTRLVTMKTKRHPGIQEDCKDPRIKVQHLNIHCSCLSSFGSKYTLLI